METLNAAFFFVCDKLVDLQIFFLGEAWKIGRTVFIIALGSAAVNYALTGAGLKENLIKIGKAVVFFIIIMGIYPRIVAHITAWTFEKANASTYMSIERYFNASREAMAEGAEEPADLRSTWGRRTMKSKTVSEERDPLKYFSGVVKKRVYGDFTYTVVAPAAALEIILLVAGECINFADNAPKVGTFGLPDFAKVLKGLLCGFFVMFTGIFAVLEYLMAFLEYMLVTGVGIILFPLSIWEGSKFMAEKLIGAIVGFFIKLLFCNICVFLMLYGFISLAKDYTTTPFSGRPEEILVVAFTCLLFFFLCKSGPGLAQSLLTGAPSLSAAGAIGSAASAVGAAAGVAGLAGKAGKAMAGGAAKTGFGAAGMLAQADSAAGAVKDLGGSGGQQLAAFMGSIGGSMKESAMSSGGELARSLLGGGGKGGSGGGGSGAGVNRHSQTQKFLSERNPDGTKKSFAEYIGERKKAGQEMGLNQMVQDEQIENYRNDLAMEKMYQRGELPYPEEPGGEPSSGAGPGKS
jgi:hypothetical protein